MLNSIILSGAGAISQVRSHIWNFNKTFKKNKETLPLVKEGGEERGGVKSDFAKVLKSLDCFNTRASLFEN